MNTLGLGLHSHLLLTYLLRGLNPQANYTDRATAACRRSDCQLFADRVCHVVSLTDPYGCILGFLDRNCCVNPSTLNFSAIT
jgi:hypothetical protein